MSSFQTNFTSIFDLIQFCWSSLELQITDSIQLFEQFWKNSDIVSSITTTYDSLQNNYLKFSDIQIIILKILTITIIINISLIYIGWRLYGKRICERFTQPATSLALEELKASVARLKLPKEHTPRV